MRKMKLVGIVYRVELLVQVAEAVVSYYDFIIFNNIIKH